MKISHAAAAAVHSARNDFGHRGRGRCRRLGGLFPGRMTDAVENEGRRGDPAGQMRRWAVASGRRVGRAVAVARQAALEIILHKRYCCGRRARARAAVSSPASSSVGRRSALSLNHAPAEPEIHLIRSASHIASDGQCTHAPLPPLPLSLLPPLALASRQFILHDANQAFVLIYAAVHSAATGHHITIPSLPSPSRRRRPCRHRYGRYSSVATRGDWRVACPTDFYDGLLPSHSYIFRLLIRIAQ